MTNSLVAFLDVDKAFDTVWIEGMFYQLHILGISGKTWRILYTVSRSRGACVQVVSSEVSDTSEGYMVTDAVQSFY